MEILSVLHIVVDKLRTFNPDMDVLISPADPKEYIPTTQQTTLLLHYCGSLFSKSESTDITLQKQILSIAITVIVPEISELINTLDRIRSLLGGISLPDCDRPLWLDNEKYIGENAGFCRYTLEMAASSLFIANQESKGLPLLKIVNHEEIQ